MYLVGRQRSNMFHLFASPKGVKTLKLRFKKKYGKLEHSFKIWPIFKPKEKVYTSDRKEASK